MKKFIFLKRIIFIIITVSVIVLSACAGEGLIRLNTEETSTDTGRVQRNLSLSFYTDSINSVGQAVVYDGLLFTCLTPSTPLQYVDPKTGYVNVLCKDTLCSHFNTGCLGDAKYITPFNMTADSEGLIILGSRAVRNSSFLGIYRFNMKNQSISTIYEWDKTSLYCRSIILKEDWIYFIKLDDECFANVYKVKKSGGTPINLTPDSKSGGYSMLEFPGDGYIYFLDSGMIYRTRDDFKTVEELGKQALSLYINDGYLYFSREIDEVIDDETGAGFGVSHIYRTKTDSPDFTSAEEIIKDSAGMNYIISDNLLFYIPLNPKRLTDERGEDYYRYYQGELTVFDLNTMVQNAVYKGSEPNASFIYYADKDKAVLWSVNGIYIYYYSGGEFIEYET